MDFSVENAILHDFHQNKNKNKNKLLKLLKSPVP